MTSTGDDDESAKDAEDVGPPPAPVDWRKKNPLKALFFAQVSPLIRRRHGQEVGTDGLVPLGKVG